MQSANKQAQTARVWSECLQFAGGSRTLLHLPFVCRDAPGQTLVRTCKGETGSHACRKGHGPFKQKGMGIENPHKSPPQAARRARGQAWKTHKGSLSRPLLQIRYAREGLGQGGLRLLDQSLEALRLAHCDVGQNLAVQFDAGLVQTVDELAIGEAQFAAASVDALDPQGAEVALLGLAVAVGVLTGLFDGLTCNADGALAAAVIAFCLFKNALVAGAARHASFHSCHDRSPSLPLCQPVGRPFLDGARAGVRNDGGAAVLTDLLGRALDHAVTLADLAVLDLAGRGELEAFFDAAFCFQLGHFAYLLMRPEGHPGSHYGPPRQPI